MNYHVIETIRNGYLPVRRWTKRIPILFASANVWLDHLINQLLNSSKEVISQSSDFIHSISTYEATILGKPYEVGKYISDLLDLEDYQAYLTGTVQGIDVLMYLLLFVSIFFWLRIASSLLFIYADFQLTYWEEGKRQYFLIFAIAFNVLVYFLIEDWAVEILSFR